MTVPDAAIEAAIEGLKKWDILTAKGREDFARTAIEAAMPAIREAIAQEIITNGPVLNWELNYDGTEDNTRAAYVEAFRDAARIVRGGAA